MAKESLVGEQKHKGGKKKKTLALYKWELIERRI